MSPRTPLNRVLLTALVLLTMACGLGQNRQEPPAPKSDSDIAAEKVDAALVRQKAALLAGDEAGYLGVLDQSMTSEDRAALTRQFQSLRAMKVAGWSDKVMTATNESGDLWSVDLIGSACFVSAPCADGQAMASTKWLIKGDTATMVDWEAGRHPHPWQADDLVAAVGQRTVVATTKKFEKDLPNLVKEADKAAVVADRYAHKQPPTRYVIYYAGPEQWKSWFQTKAPHWSSGVAVDVSHDRYEVVLNAGDMNADAMPIYLRHELAHASSMPGRVVSSDWWLIEGIAELAGFDGMPARFHPGIGNAREALARSKTGFQLAEPTASDEQKLVSGAYAVAFLGTRCLSERFSEGRFVQFFHAVVHESKSVTQASDQIFGVEWSSLNSECGDYINSAAR